MRRLKNLARAGGLVALGWIVAHQATTIGAQQNKPTTVDEKPQIVAYVNGVAITRQELGEEMIARRGKQQLELLINRRIIQQAAQKAGITVTDAEVDEELRDMIRLGNFRNAAEFEKEFLEKTKRLSLFEFKEDVVRLTLIVKKIAGKQLEVTEAEIKKAYEAKFGEKVQCCIILEKDKKIALSMYAEINGDPKEFYRVAKRQADPRLAAGAGRIVPMGRNTTYPTVEKRAFEMKDGEISEVIETKEGCVILLRENAVQATQKSYPEEHDAIRAEILEKKMCAEVPKLFKAIKERASVQDYLNNRHSNGLIEELEKFSNKNP